MAAASRPAHGPICCAIANGVGCAPRFWPSGDGALGFWGALREVFPETRAQRCWFHKIANVLAALPKSAHPGAKKALAEIWNAEDEPHALGAVKSFKLAYGAKFGKAVAKITDDLDELLAFYDFPAEHWIHLRTTNPIESTFATVRHRTKITRGPDRRRPASRWRSSSSRPPRPVGGQSTPRIWSRSSAPAPAFENGKLVERPAEHTQAEAAYKIFIHRS